MFCWDSTLSASGLTPDLVESLATEEQVTKVCDVLLLGPWVASAGSTLRPALDGEWHDSSLAYWAVGRTEWVSRFLGEPFRVSYFDLSVGVWNTTDGKHFVGFQLDDQKFSHGERGIFSALPWFRERSLANLILTNFSAELIFGELLGESALQDLIWAWFVLLLVSYCLHLLVKTLELRRQRPFYKLSETVKASLRVPLSLQDKQPHKSCSASRADAEGRMRVLPWHSWSPFTSQSGVSLTHKKLRQVHWVVGSKSRSSGARLQAVIANIKRPPQSWTTGPLWSLQSSFRWK